MVFTHCHPQFENKYTLRHVLCLQTRTGSLHLKYMKLKLTVEKVFTAVVLRKTCEMIAKKKNPHPSASPL